MTTTRDVGRVLGLRRSGQTNSDTLFACGSQGFTAQGHGGPILVTCHVDSGDRNHARTSLPEQGLWNGTAEPDQVPPTPGYLVWDQGANAELKQHATLTLWRLWRKTVPAHAALPAPNMSDPAAAQPDLALVVVWRCRWSLAI
jgi:hypothetical protein